MREREREEYSESKKVREASQQCIHGQEVSRRGWLTLPSHQPPQLPPHRRPAAAGKGLTTVHTHTDTHSDTHTQSAFTHACSAQNTLAHTLKHTGYGLQQAV